MTPIQSPKPSTITVATQRVVWAVIAQNNGQFPIVSGGKVTLAFSSNDIIIHRTSATDNALGLANGNTTAYGSYFDTATKIWHFGSLAVGPENQKVLFIETSLPSNFDLLNDLPITLTMVISVDGISDSLAGNNTQIHTLFAPTNELECAPVAGPMDGSCRCSVAVNDTPCNYGQTVWELVPGSFVNVDETLLDFDTATGEYNKHLINPTLPGSFQYRMRCITPENPSGFGPYGPVTETINPFYIVGNDVLDSVPGTTFTPDEIAQIKLDPRYSGFSTNDIETSHWFTLRDINGNLISAILVISIDPGQALTIGTDGAPYLPIPVPVTPGIQAIEHADGSCSSGDGTGDSPLNVPCQSCSCNVQLFVTNPRRLDIESAGPCGAVSFASAVWQKRTALNTWSDIQIGGTSLDADDPGLIGGALAAEQWVRLQYSEHGCTKYTVMQMVYTP